MKNPTWHERLVSRRWPRIAAQATIAAAGLAAIVGSGGNLSLSFPDCPPDLCPPYVWVDLKPPRTTAQVGQDVVFTATVDVYGNLPSPSYTWCRLPAGASTCEPIAGAHGRSLRVERVNLSDDGSKYSVHVKAGSAGMTSEALLMVSAAPPVVFGDGDFVPGSWTSYGFEVPTRTPTSAIAVAQSQEGGNPGAFMSVTYGPLATGATLLITHVAEAATYDPAQSGAIYSIDFRAECKALAGYGARMSVRPMLRQGARTYFAGGLAEQYCESATTWAFDEGRGSIVASDFTIFEGPACGAAESCPDFSAAAAPITFGLTTSNNFVDASTTPAHGVDNWQVSVWRR